MMNKKECIFPFLFIGLSIAFSVVCVAVFLSNGKSKKWISWKMKIGGFLLVLSTVSCNSYRKVISYTSCYLVVDSLIIDTGIEEKNIELENARLFSDASEISLVNKNTIIGNILGISFNNLSFILSDSIGQSFQTGRLVDGYNYNSISGDFEIVLDTNPNAGNYNLYIYNSPVESQSTEMPLIVLGLNVKDE